MGRNWLARKAAELGTGPVRCSGLPVKAGKLSSTRTRNLSMTSMGSHFDRNIGSQNLAGENRHRVWRLRLSTTALRASERRQRRASPCMEAMAGRRDE